MRARFLNVTALVASLTMAVSGTAWAGQATTTGFFAAGAYQRTIEGVINVCPSNSNECDVEGPVRVKLFKKRDGVWVRLATKPAEDIGGSRYVSFENAPRAGRCKMTAIFLGTETHEGSRGSVTGGCAEENWM